MVKIIIDQYIKEVPSEEPLECIEMERKFSFLVKFERRVSKGKTQTCISYRDTRKDMDYRLIHETISKEEYENFVNFFIKEGYHKL